jgi:tetratricopeptide (TPR) repeat protein
VTDAELLAEGRRRYEAGDVADAEPLARRALELRPEDGPARAEALQLVAEIEYGQGRYADAQQTAEAARRLRDGSGAEALAETDNLLGIIAVARGDVPAALPLLEGALAARERALGQDAADTIESLNNLAAAIARDGRIEEAIALNRDALARCERAFTEPHRQLAVSLNALGVKLDRDPATRAEAGEMYARALAAAEAALGPEHPMVATLLANLATQRLNVRDAEGARPFVARSLDLHDRRYGPTHPNTATALLNGVELARVDGDLATARALVERSLAIRLAAFGPLDIRTRQAVVRLMTVLAAMQAVDGPVRNDGILILEVQRALIPAPGGAPLPPPDPAVIDRLRAYLDRRLAAAGEPDEASRRALDRARLATVAADAAFVAGDLDAARVALDDAIRGTEVARGPDHLDLVELLRRRAVVARADDRRDEAIPDDERALRILGVAYGGRHPYVLRARTRLAGELQREYGPAAARPVLTEIRGSLEGLAAEGIGDQLRAIVDRHLERIPADAEPDPIGRSARRRRALATADGLGQRILPDVDRIDWAALTHARGRATDVPTNLRLLAAHDPIVVRDAADRLAEALLDERGLEPATAEIVEPVLALAGDPSVPHRRAASESLVARAAEVGVHATPRGGVPDDGVRRAIARHVPAIGTLLRRLAEDPDPDVRAAARAARTHLVKAGVIAQAKPWN